MSHSIPRVSVVMSVFNGADYLEAAVDSILLQTFRDFEFIVVDDGSTDRSAEIIESYKDQRLILVQQENRCLERALNRGLELARGEYVARQDADDVSMPERFAAQIRFLDAHPDVDVLGTGSLLIDSKGCPFSKFLPFTQHERLVAELLRGVCPLMHGSVMVRRDAILSAGAYNPAFKRIQDVELWLRMSTRYRLANIRDILYQLRKHDLSVTQVARIDLRIREFARTGQLSQHTRVGDWQSFMEAFDRDSKGGLWERAFEAENHLRKAQIAFTKREPWRALRHLGRAFWLNPRLSTDLPNRVFHRLWRTAFPMVG